MARRFKSLEAFTDKVVALLREKHGLGLIEAEILVGRIPRVINTLFRYGLRASDAAAGIMLVKNRRRKNENAKKAN